MLRISRLLSWTGPCLLLAISSRSWSQAVPVATAPPDLQIPQRPADSYIPQEQRTAPIGQRIPQQDVATRAALQGEVKDTDGRPQPGLLVRLQRTQVPELSPRTDIGETYTSGDGIFRLLRIPPGTYDLVFIRPESAPVQRTGVQLNAGEVLSIMIRLPPAADTTRMPMIQTPTETLNDPDYTELSRRPDAAGVPMAKIIDPISQPDKEYFKPERDRWDVPVPPPCLDRQGPERCEGYHRYPSAETPYVMGHWYDPFNRNLLKGDQPLFGKTFFSFTGTAVTAVEGRRLYIPSPQAETEPGEFGFFGNGGQFFLAQTFRFTFDLFHGDTTSFKPVDWRIRITPAANVNYLNAHENGVVSPDVREGTTRTDGHVGLQEAFGEVKLHDLSSDYDFVSLRAGIQQFSSDFRGFVFADEQPGVRIFGNLRANRIQFNLVGFDLLEKNTNSGLNTFDRRGRDVAIANVYIQDFLAKGYTAQFSYHFVRDNGSTHYDDNGFLVRPAAIGNVTPHRIDADYFGWTGDGHIGRLNLTHAFYQVLGHDQLNEIANVKTGINAQLGAVEFSRDFDWLRFRTSFLFASGDNNARDTTARGFSSIVDGVAFAGGEFSFFNREGIPFTRAGVALTAPDSFLPDLRTSKDEGQSNFVNPGLLLTNAGFDADLLPQLKLVGNVNFLQFARTQTLDFLLQQNRVPRTIGTDAGLGVIWGPLLSDNIVVHGGATTLVPGSGLRQIYTSKTLYSLFALVKFQF